MADRPKCTENINRQKYLIKTEKIYWIKGFNSTRKRVLKKKKKKKINKFKGTEKQWIGVFKVLGCALNN